MTGLPKLWTDAAQRMAASVPVIVATPQGTPRGTVLLVHGRNGAPAQPQIAEIALAYLARGWRVAAPELPHSAALPDSGPPDQLTFTGHVRAATGVWDWVAQQWPDTPRALAGHSLGGFAVAHLAAASDDTHHVLAMSPPMSGQVLKRAREAMGPAAIDEVRRESPAYFAEMQTADAEPALNLIAAPLAVVTGSEDGLIPLKDARAYFMAAQNGRFFGALPGEHHCPAGAPCAGMLNAALTALGA
ncbi:alpha/beta hydrolase [Paracoccus laeviglucosivorans]|uniref:Esterase/lipase n=1 Tax=Paracoccus laeviglucosivorans TaxID=1197861 RepID=A0A521D4U1_9RHOB|nr:alpha/beta hydrolase [Paracoccus laeviglucosivorans]SMO65910.1 Esterase/lipase [Paracoccus laeviglucosivorans]